MRVVKKEDHFELWGTIDLNLLNHGFEKKFSHVVEMTKVLEWLPTVNSWELKGTGLVCRIDKFEYSTLEKFLKVMIGSREERFENVEANIDNFMVLHDELLYRWNGQFREFLGNRGFVAHIVPGFFDDTVMTPEGDILFLGLDKFVLHRIDFPEQRSYCFRAIFNDLMREKTDRQHLAKWTVPFIFDEEVYSTFLNEKKHLEERESFLKEKMDAKDRIIESMFSEEDLIEKLGEEMFEELFKK